MPTKTSKPRLKKNKPLLIFDLDGTLYELHGGSYKTSLLRRKVLRNAQKFIAAKLYKSNREAGYILTAIKKEYGEKLSIGLEKELALNRYEYFSTVWNIPARGIVRKQAGLRQALLAVRKTYKLILVSDAPQVWIGNVLKQLGVADLFRKTIFSGEGNRRKGRGNAFASITASLRVDPRTCVSIGDQEETDIIPAKEIGMRSISMQRTKRPTMADVSIATIRQLPEALEQLSKTSLRK